MARKVANKYKTVSTYKEFENHANWIVGELGWEQIIEYAANLLNQVSE